LLSGGQRKLRHAKGISQESWLSWLGFTGHYRTYIGGVERGNRNIALVNMVRIATALELPLSRLISEME
jgi:hypothetical protein